MNIISANEFIDKFGLDAAREVISHNFSDSSNYYCHIYKVGKVEVRSTWADKPNIKYVDWVKISDLKETIIGGVE